MHSPLKPLSLEQLQEIRDNLTDKVRLGLSQPDQEVLCLPAYLQPPAADLSGEAVVVDAGGTNVRAAWLSLSHQIKVLAGPLHALLPDGRTPGQPVGRAEFFGRQADLIARLQTADGTKIAGSGSLPLGYCFSYPAEVLSNRDARLLFWTKGIQIEGVVGTEVGQGLSQAANLAFEKESRNGRIGSCVVLNDTVAALMGAAYLGRQRHRNFIGLIVGTGTNMATFFQGERLSKIANAPQEMAVNLESGNFHPPHLEAWDEQVDAQSLSPGQSRFEKAVSGFYLGQVFEKILPDLNGFDPAKGAAAVVEVAQTSPNSQAIETARYVLDRSADLVAAALASLHPFYPSGSLGICAEGGLFWGSPGYSARVQDRLKTLLPQSACFEIMQLDNVNLVGTACAALS